MSTAMRLLFRVRWRRSSRSVQCGTRDVRSADPTAMDQAKAHLHELVTLVTSRRDDAQLQRPNMLAVADERSDSDDVDGPAAAAIGSDLVDLEGDHRVIARARQHPVAFGAKYDAAAVDHVVDRGDHRQCVGSDGDPADAALGEQRATLLVRQDFEISGHWSMVGSGSRSEQGRKSLVRAIRCCDYGV